MVYKVELNCRIHQPAELGAILVLFVKCLEPIATQRVLS